MPTNRENVVDQEGTIDSLLPELLRKIFSMLDGKALVRSAHTQRKWTPFVRQATNELHYDRSKASILAIADTFEKHFAQSSNDYANPRELERLRNLTNRAHHSHRYLRELLDVSSKSILEYTSRKLAEEVAQGMRRAYRNELILVHYVNFPSFLRSAYEGYDQLLTPETVKPRPFFLRYLNELLSFEGNLFNYMSTSGNRLSDDQLRTSIASHPLFKAYELNYFFKYLDRNQVEDAIQMVQFIDDNNSRLKGAVSLYLIEKLLRKKDVPINTIVKVMGSISDQEVDIKGMAVRILSIFNFEAAIQFVNALPPFLAVKGEAIKQICIYLLAKRDIEGAIIVANKISDSSKRSEALLMCINAILLPFGNIKQALDLAGTIPSSDSRFKGIALRLISKNLAKSEDVNDRKSAIDLAKAIPKDEKRIYAVALLDICRSWLSEDNYAEAVEVAEIIPAEEGIIKGIALQYICERMVRADVRNYQWSLRLAESTPESAIWIRSLTLRYICGRMINHRHEIERAFLLANNLENGDKVRLLRELYPSFLNEDILLKAILVVQSLPKEERALGAQVIYRGMCQCLGYIKAFKKMHQYGLSNYIWFCWR